MKKLLYKLFANYLFKIEKVDKTRMTNWLFNSYKDRGYSQYFTMRKKYIANVMSMGMSQEEYWMHVGRIQELRSLNDNILREFKIREKKKVLDKKTNPLNPKTAIGLK